MIFNISNYVSGIVRIRIRGDMPEKFVNLCIANHIFLWEIVKCDDDFYANIRLHDFFCIRSITRISKVNIHVVSFRGIPFVVRRIKRRRMMFIGAILSLILLNVMASYIWFVDVTGVKSLTVDQIKEIAFQNGLKPGIAKDSVRAKQIEQQILLTVPEIAWVGVTFSGTRAEVEVVEKTMQKQEDKGPADIVAAKDGVITEFIVLAGKPLVKKGDTVRKGDLLITGIVTEQTQSTETGQTIVNHTPIQLVKANGIIKARVWYETYGEGELTEPIHQRTGKKEMAVDIRIGGNIISLKSAALNPNADFETEVIHKKLPVWRNSGVAVESEINIYHEVNTVWLEKSVDEARDEARSKALARVQSLMPETAHILSRSSEVLETAEPNLVRVKVSVESIEEIGRSVMLSNQ